jgi:hypothetical protein
MGRELTVHIGIASGRVVASGTGSDSHQEYTVTGESVNLASRLQEMARGGESYISEAVYQATQRLISSRAIGDVSVKGLDEPITTYQLNGLLGADEGAASMAFVGRQPELRKFRGAVEDCLETGRGEIIYILGDVGIGKTTLLNQFDEIARDLGFSISVLAKGRMRSARWRGGCLIYPPAPRKMFAVRQHKQHCMTDCSRNPTPHSSTL